MVDSAGQAGLVQALAEPGNAGREIAYRHGKRFLLDLQRMEMPATDSTNLKLRHQGSYLCVGGAGG